MFDEDHTIRLSPMMRRTANVRTVEVSVDPDKTWTNTGVHFTVAGSAVRRILEFELDTENARLLRDYLNREVSDAEA